MIYLASPYSHPDPIIRKTRYLLALETTANLCGEGQNIFSPIVHCYYLDELHDLPGDAFYWRQYNVDMLRRCDALFVLTIPGWEESKGVHHEMQVANSLYLPVSFVAVGGKHT